MIAAVLTELNAPLTLADVEPMPLEYGQVLVRVLVSGICGAQLQEIRGEKGNASYVPHLLGHEGCGIVEEVGPGVTKLCVGDKVVMHWRVGAGIESPFPRYRFDAREITSGKVTTFSEMSVCSENRLTKVPRETPNELCALLGCGLSTALGVLENEAKLRMGESVLIVGCGGVGLNLIRCARMIGASRIAAVDLHDKQASAIASGADTFCSSADGFVFFDVIVDTSGSPSAIAESIRHLAPSGRYIMVGQPGPKQGIMLHGARHMFDGTGKSIKATQGGGFNPETDIPRYVSMWRSRVLTLDGIVSHRFPLKRINEGLDLVRDGQAGRVILEMT